ncbi:MAG: hypothetical protein KatS3mg009_1092 [Acidimicrobiia bacterium]|nr:MAG: hypothetical protein KatS3mg009_1092 [Acidimicrobiia bacterium]
MVRSSRFVGREAERARLAALACEPGALVTVTGPGGVGKTRLVAETIASLGTEAVVAELDPLPAGAGPEALAGRLGFGGADAAGAALAGRDVLVVLDNCEHVLGAVRELVTRIRHAAGPRVVATSREPLGLDGEVVVPLGPLAVADPGSTTVEDSPAVQLFLDRAAAAGAGWDRSPRTLDTVARLCRELDGIPLAIELAAARARALSPADLLANTEHRLALLRRPARGGPGDRHESWRAAVDVSYELLDADERAVFERCSMFAGPFDVDLAHAVAAPAGHDRLHTIDLVARLVDRSLIVADTTDGPTRYRMLTLVREYARESLERHGGRADAEHRFVDAMARFADDVIERGSHEWSGDLLTTIESQFENLVAAIDLAIGRDDGPERAFRLVLPLYPMVHASRPLEVLSTGTRVLSRWPDRSAPWRAEVHAVLANAAIVTADTGRARELADRALTDPGATPVGHVLASRALGFADRLDGAYEDARRHFARGREVAAGLGLTPFARELAGYEDGALDLAGDTDGAVALLGPEIAAAVAGEDLVNEAWLRLVRATAHLRVGDAAAARRDVERAAAAADALRYAWWGGALRRTHAALVAVEAGWDASRPHWWDAVEYAVALGSVGGVALSLRAAAACAQRDGRPEVARALEAATPRSSETTVLQDLFAHDPGGPGARVDAPAGPADLATALARARAVLLAPGPEPSHRPAPAAPAAPAAAEMVHDGDGWTITYAGETVRAPASRGSPTSRCSSPAPARRCTASTSWAASCSMPGSGPRSTSGHAASTARASPNCAPRWTTRARPTIRYGRSAPRRSSTRSSPACRRRSASAAAPARAARPPSGRGPR